jgi:hypothetical protein
MESTLTEYCVMPLMLGTCGNRINDAAREYAVRYTAHRLSNAKCVSLARPKNEEE